MKTKHLLLPILFYLIPLIAFGDNAQLPPVAPAPIITDAYRLNYKPPPDSSDSSDEEKQKRRTAGINDTIVIEISNLKTLTNQALCLDDSNLPKKGCKTQGIDLYLDGKKISERDPNGSLGQPNTIEFELKYGSDKDLKNNWARLLSTPSTLESLRTEFFQRPVKLAVGLDNADSNLMLELKDGIQLRRIDMLKFWLCIGFLILVAIFVTRSKDIKKMIREALSDIGPPPPLNLGLKQWSLARCQMAFWFIFVVVSFLSIWVVTGALDTINTTVLALIGIGSGTALGSAMIDVSNDTQSKIDELLKKADAIKAEILKIDIEAATATAGSTQTQFLTLLKKVTQDRLDTVNDQITRRSSITISKGFWNDILNDQEGGVGFHRVQMVVWTLILGLIFVYSVWQTLSMPEFSETLLALQGISAGTYLGFKMPDKT